MICLIIFLVHLLWFLLDSANQLSRKSIVTFGGVFNCPCRPSLYSRCMDYSIAGHGSYRDNYQTGLVVPIVTGPQIVHLSRLKDRTRFEVRISLVTNVLRSVVALMKCE